MCSSTVPAPTLAVILLAVACSAGKSQNQPDAAQDARDSASLGDSRKDTAAETQIDQAPRVDARDATAELDAPGDIRGDAKSADSAGDARDADGAAARDGGAEAGDAPANPSDASSDGKKLDAVADAPPGHGCSNPIVIPLDNPHADLTVSTVGAGHHVDLPCAQGGPDLVFLFTLEETQMVYADTFGATWNTILSFSDRCPMVPETDDSGAGFISCNDDACNTTQSQVVAAFPSNDRYLILSGANGESGSVTVHFDHAPIGTGPVAALPLDVNTVSGTLDGYGPQSDACLMPGPDSTYWWATCPDYLGGDMTASTCKGTPITLDTTLLLQIPRSAGLTCNDDDDACGKRSTISTTVAPGAGLNVLTVGSMFGSLIPSQEAYLLTYTVP